MSKASKRPPIVMPGAAEDRAITAAAKADPDAQPLTPKQLAAMVPLQAPRGRPKSADARQAMSRIVFTGGPGAGKTTLLLALQALGCTIVGDSARAVIQERLQRGLPPRPSPQAFAQEVLRRDIENHAALAAAPGLVFFDRGIVDALGMLAEVMPLTESELSDWIVKHPYEPKVFVFPAWRDIYVNDAERDHTFEHAQAVDRSVRAWYARCGYQFVEVPKVSVAERCAYVLQSVASGKVN